MEYGPETEARILTELWLAGLMIYLLANTPAIIICLPGVVVLPFGA